MTSTTAKPGLHTLLTESLRFGQDHLGLAMNVRKTDRAEGIDALAASIRGDGILQPLLVWRDTEGDGHDYVVDGSRRLTAVRYLIDTLPVTDETPHKLETLPCLLTIGGSAADALAKSLAANVMQLPLHPVDQYEAFAEVQAGGEPGIDSIALIASRFGISKEVVGRRLALGNLAKPIRDAWRADEIDADAAKTYTLETDQARQVDLFKKLGKNARGNRYRIRTAILGEGDVGHLLAFVGADEYEAQGGGVVKDLFVEDRGGDGVTDRALLKKMVELRVQEKCASIIAAGWAWASAAADLPNDWQWKWTRNRIGAKGATDKQKAAMGAALEIGPDGKLLIEYGIQKPGAKVEKETTGAKAGKADKAAHAEPKLSQNMERQLARTATIGLANALRDDTMTGLRALLAGIASKGEGPVRIEARGLSAREADRSDPMEFEAAFKAMSKKGGKDVYAAIALVCASAVDLVMSGDPLPFQDPGAHALASALNPKALNKALRAAWNPAEYFEGVSKALCITAITEGCGAAAADSLPPNATKGEVAEWAAKEVPKTGWLPPELRAPGYDGPGKTTAKATAKKARR